MRSAKTPPSRDNRKDLDHRTSACADRVFLVTPPELGGGATADQLVAVGRASSSLLDGPVAGRAQ